MINDLDSAVARFFSSYCCCCCCGILGWICFIMVPFITYSLFFLYIALVAHAVKMQQLPVTLFVSIITVHVTLMLLQLLYGVSERE